MCFIVKFHTKIHAFAGFSGKGVFFAKSLLLYQVAFIRLHHRRSSGAVLCPIGSSGAGNGEVIGLYRRSKPDRNGHADPLGDGHKTGLAVRRRFAADPGRPLTCNDCCAHSGRRSQRQRLGYVHTLHSDLTASPHRAGLLPLIGQDGLMLISLIDSQKDPLVSRKLYPTGYAPFYVELPPCVPGIVVSLTKKTGSSLF